MSTSKGYFSIKSHCGLRFHFRLAPCYREGARSGLPSGCNDKVA